MIKYKEWINAQDEAFKGEIALNDADNRFIDRKFMSITLDELKKLDNKYCNDEVTNCDHKY